MRCIFITFDPSSVSSSHFNLSLSNHLENVYKLGKCATLVFINILYDLCSIWKFNMAARCQLCWLVEIFNLLFPETILKGCSIIHYPICSLCWSEMVATGQCSIIELYTIGTYIIDYGAEQKRFVWIGFLFKYSHEE